METFDYVDLEFFCKTSCYEKNVYHKTAWSSFEKASAPGQAQQDWDRGFILLPPHAAVLPGSDTGSVVVMSALSFVIQKRQTSCSVLCQMYGTRY